MKNANIYNGLNLTTKEINSNFKIKVAGVDENGNRINKLVGVAGLILLIGIEFVNKLIKKAFNSINDKCVCKLRRGIKVTFYAI